MKEQTYTKDRIIEIIDEEIKAIMKHKDNYIKLNGVDENVKRFDEQMATLSMLYGKF